MNYRDITIGDRVRLRTGMPRTRIRPAGSLGTVYDLVKVPAELEEDVVRLVMVRWDEDSDRRDDDIAASQLEKL